MVAQFVKSINCNELSIILSNQARTRSKNQLKPELIKDIIDDENVYVYGSSIWKYLTNNKCLIDDIDVVIQYKNVNTFMIKFNELIKKYNMFSTKTSSRIRSYNYSKFICHDYKLFIYNDNKSGLINIIQITVIVDTITPENFLNYQLPFKVLRNYYNCGNVYYNQKDLMTESLSLSKIIKYSTFVKKYTARGVKFDVINDLTQRKKTESVFTLTKYINKYNKLGFVVIPLSDNDRFGEGKCPVVKNWTNLTLNNKISINIYNNIGIVCGKNSGIMCIDIDTKDDGVKHFTQLINKYKFPVGTPFQKTPNGGFHYIFKYEPSKMDTLQSKIKFFTLNNKNVGVDFWVNKVQFVVEPSINKLSGDKYEWVIEPTKDNIKELPDWVFELYNKGAINEEYEIIAAQDCESTIEETEIVDITKEEQNIAEQEQSVSFFTTIYNYFSS
jgi:hypothetical protein